MCHAAATFFARPSFYNFVVCALNALLTGCSPVVRKPEQALQHAESVLLVQNRPKSGVCAVLGQMRCYVESWCALSTISGHRHTAGPPHVPIRVLGRGVLAPPGMAARARGRKVLQPDRPPKANARSPPDATYLLRVASRVQSSEFI